MAEHVWTAQDLAALITEAVDEVVDCYTEGSDTTVDFYVESEASVHDRHIALSAALIMAQYLAWKTTPQDHDALQFGLVYPEWFREIERRYGKA
jgi:hypothetical protein